LENDPGTFDGSDSEDNGEIAAEGYDDGEYREKPSARRATSDISNTYSNCATQNLASRRRTRRLKAYEGRGHEADPSGDANLPGERCPYVSPGRGKRCEKINKSPQEAARHWRSCHLYKEAKAMLTGFLAAGRGNAITSKAQLDEVTPRIQCAFCRALITRSDAMRRHARTNCKAVEDDKTRGMVRGRVERGALDWD
jgi:hypothetical protein